MNSLSDSILISVKKLLGLDSTYAPFDTDIIIHINTVLFTLYQLGVGPKKPFHIESSSEVWGDFLDNIDDLEAVKTYTYLKVKLIFDPPTNSSHLKAIQDLVAEYESRLNYEVDPGKEAS